MKPILAPLYPSSLFLLFVTLLVTGESAPIYSPTDDIDLDCGSPEDTVSDYDFQTWTGDINSKFFPKEVGGTSQVAKAPLSSSRGSQVPYTTSYGDSETLLREFCLNFEADERSLNITCIHSQQGWIRVYQRDRNHVHANQSLPLGSRRRWGQASYLGSSDSRYYVENNTALEMIYRINVGGSPVSPNEDTGTYRTWNPTDKFYLNDQSKTLSSVSRSNITHLNFARIPNYTAPEEVNQTGRTMGGNNTINNSYNLTWGFRIDPNFSYLVRLHFGEIESNVTKAGDRMFQIFIANLIAEPYIC